MKSVSIIICTFNEEQTISEVVTSCCKYNKKSEIIVVDDGSTDHTESILAELQDKCNFRYEKLPQNRGKSWAMAHGVEISANEIAGNLITILPAAIPEYRARSSSV